jgi:hypothetical protein
VVEVEAEIAVVIEEVRAVLQRDLLVLCPFGGLEYCGVGAPLRYQIYTNSDPRGLRHLRRRRFLATRATMCGKARAAGSGGRCCASRAAAGMAVADPLS